MARCTCGHDRLDHEIHWRWFSDKPKNRCGFASCSCKSFKQSPMQLAEEKMEQIQEQWRKDRQPKHCNRCGHALQEGYGHGCIDTTVVKTAVMRKQQARRNMSDIVKEYEEIKIPLMRVIVPRDTYGSDKLYVGRCIGSQRIFFSLADVEDIDSKWINISKAHALELADLLKEMAG